MSVEVSVVTLLVSLQTVAPKGDQCHHAGDAVASATVASPASVRQKALPFSGHNDPDSLNVNSFGSLHSIGERYAIFESLHSVGVRYIAKPFDHSWETGGWHGVARRPKHFEYRRRGVVRRSPGRCTFSPQA